MVRTIIVPENTEVQVSIPEEYIGKKVEITCLSLEELEQKPVPQYKLSDLAGTLSHQTAEQMLKYVDEGRDKWEDRLKK